MLKNSPDAVKCRILKLYNEIFNITIPQQYKTSLIIPILKPNCDKTLTKSCRAISLNSCIGKIMDRIIANRIWWLVSCNNLLNGNQMGFRRGKSTSDALMFLEHLAVNSLSTKNHLTVRLMIKLVFIKLLTN